MNRPFRMPKARFATYLLLASLAPTILAVGLGLGIESAWDRYQERGIQTNRLLAVGSYVAAMIHDLPLGINDPALHRQLKNLSLVDDLRITVILRDGTVLTDTTNENIAGMENHAGREEIRAALSGRNGTSLRKSATTGVDYLYAAQPYREKEEITAAIRVAKAVSRIRTERTAIFSRMLFIGLLYAILAALVSYTISGIFGSYARRMSDNAAQMAGGNFDLRLKRVHIEELDVLGKALNLMAENIDQNMRELSQEKEELESVRDELRKTVGLKESYLKELQHRVKNNLNVISSMLNLEIGRLKDPAAQQSFREMAARVDTVSRIYETLYKSADLETVDLKPYLEGLTAAIHRAYVADHENCQLETDIAAISLDSKKALPLGLILNECLSNAFKYAFPPTMKGTIRVRVDETPTGLVFSVSDDGVGFPPNFDPRASDTLGLQLVEMLAKQLHAELKISGDGGVAVEIRIEDRRTPFPAADESAT